jgi:tRNA(Ile)-lysidine synthase
MNRPETTDLLKDVADAVNRSGLITSGQRIIVAVSGGADSVAMLDLLHRLSADVQFDLHVAHLNHQLRGDAADRDAAGVERLARDYGIECTVGSADVQARSKREGRSLEDAARQERFEFLESVRRAHGGHRVALGHHRNDQAETVLMRLFRGSGATGLGAMAPARDDVWVRPLLDISRSRISDYARERQLPFTFDESNKDEHFLRNRVRNSLIPHLEAEYNPGIVATLARSAQLLRDEDEYLDNVASEACSKALLHRDSRKLVLAGSVLSGYHISIKRRMLRKILKDGFPAFGDFDFDAIQRILALLERGCGSAQISSGLSGHMASDRLYIFTEASPFKVPIAVPGRTPVDSLGLTIETSVRPAQELRNSLKSSGSDRAFFDMQGLDLQSLAIRNRQPGDRFRPFGSGGSRTVSDFLIDEKVPRPLRDEVPLMVCGDTVLWVVGMRTAQPSSVSATTRQILETRVFSAD